MGAGAGVLSAAHFGLREVWGLPRLRLPPTPARSGFSNLHTHTHTRTHVQTHTHVHTHVHTYTHAHMYTHTYTQTHTHARAHMCTHACTHTYTHVHTYIETHARTCTHTQTHAHMRAHMHTYTHTDTHTCTRTHRHTRMRAHAHRYARTHMYTDMHAHTHIRSAPWILPWALGPILPWPYFCGFARLSCPGAQPPPRTLPVLLPEWFSLQSAPAAPGWAVLPRLQNAHSTHFSTRMPWPGTRPDTRDGPGGWKSEIRVPVGPCLPRPLSGVCGWHLLHVLMCPLICAPLARPGASGMGPGGCPGARG